MHQHPGKKTEPRSGRLSAAEQKIIESYQTTMEGLAAYFGSAFEFVLHDLTDYDHSIIKINNGFHSGRREGSPITDLALSMLEQIKTDKASSPYISYSSRSKYGKPVRSTTIIIFGEEGRAIGLLCINLYLDSPLSSLLENFSLAPPADYITENFSSDSGELIARALEKAKSEAGAGSSIPRHQRNKEIITILYHQGIFKLKNAVQTTARELGISRNTVYLHLRTLAEQ
jgi:predicted transcriptional regulator YheO